MQSLDQHLDKLLVVMLGPSNSASSGFTPWQLLELMLHREQRKLDL